MVIEAAVGAEGAGVGFVVAEGEGKTRVEGRGLVGGWRRRLEVGAFEL